MAWTPDLSSLIPSPPASVRQVRIVLPGGLVVGGVPQAVAPSGLQSAQALLGAANAAMAPLGPAFAVVEAVLAIKDFAEAVPSVLTQPQKVVEAILGVVEKSDALLSLVPALSVPVALAGVLDALVQFLDGLAAEVSALALQAQRVESARVASASAPALLALIPQAEAQLAGYRANVESALGAAGPLLEVVNALASMAGLRGLSLDVDVSGGLDALAASLAASASALQVVRAALPV